MWFYKYTIYPEAQKKIKDSGLDARIKDSIKNRTFDISALFGNTFTSDRVDAIRYMKEDGYLNDPKHLKKLKGFVRNPENHSWTVKKSAVESMSAKDDDFKIISGYFASLLLNPEEFDDFRNFGFDSSYEFSSVLSAYIKLVYHTIDHPEEYWDSKNGEKTFKSSVGADMDGDLKIFRFETTPYETTDPLGNPVLYRPVFPSDKQLLNSYHSVEPSLLAIVLKYLHHNKNIQSKFSTELGIKSYLIDIQELEQQIGPFGDFGYDASNATFAFGLFNRPIPQLDEKNSTAEWTGDMLPAALGFGGHYGIYVGNDGSLVFAHEGENKNDSKKIALSIPSQETDNLVERLFYQAASGRGRTSVRQLMEVLNYRYSDEFAVMQKLNRNS